MSDFTLCTSCHKHMATLSGKCYRCHRTEQMKRVTRRHESGDGSRRAKGASLPIEFWPQTEHDRETFLEVMEDRNVQWWVEGEAILWREGN